jgi:hypothetical protein
MPQNFPAPATSLSPVRYPPYVVVYPHTVSCHTHTRYEFNHHRLRAVKPCPCPAALSPFLPRDRRAWRRRPAMSGRPSFSGRDRACRHKASILRLWPAFLPKTRLAQDAADTRFCTTHITSKLTGVSPMPCIGKMEPFQPSRTGWNGGETPHNGRKANTRRRLLGFPSCPGCDIHDRTLGPASENPGRWAGGGRSASSAEK